MFHEREFSVATPCHRSRAGLVPLPPRPRRLETWRTFTVCIQYGTVSLPTIVADVTVDYRLV